MQNPAETMRVQQDEQRRAIDAELTKRQQDDLERRLDAVGIAVKSGLGSAPYLLSHETLCALLQQAEQAAELKAKLAETNAAFQERDLLRPAESPGLVSADQAKHRQRAGDWLPQVGAPACQLRRLA